MAHRGSWRDSKTRRPHRLDVCVNQHSQHCWALLRSRYRSFERSQVGRTIKVQASSQRLRAFEHSSIIGPVCFDLQPSRMVDLNSMEIDMQVNFLNIP
jgi:hypothetical protein